MKTNDGTKAKLEIQAAKDLIAQVAKHLQERGNLDLFSSTRIEQLERRLQAAERYLTDPDEIVNGAWMFEAKSGTYHAEVSELKLVINGKPSDPWNRPIQNWGRWKTMRDGNDDITGWSGALTTPSGQVFKATIFND